MTKLYIFLCFLTTLLITLIVVVLGIIHDPLILGFLVLLPYSLMYTYDGVVYDLRKAVKKGLREPSMIINNCKSLNSKNEQWSVGKFPSIINYDKVPIPTSSIMLIGRMFYNWGIEQLNSKAKNAPI